MNLIRNRSIVSIGELRELFGRIKKIEGTSITPQQFYELMERAEQQKWVGPHMQAVLDKRNPYAQHGVFPSIVQEVWRGLTIGGFEKSALRQALLQADMELDVLASHLIRHQGFTTDHQRRTVRLAKTKIRALGFTKDPMLMTLLDRVLDIGGALCPAEVGPHLRITYADQPHGTWIPILMTPFGSPHGKGGVFVLESPEGTAPPRLSAFQADYQTKWNADWEVVYILANTG